MDKRLGENVTQHHIVGDKMSIADFCMAAILNSLFLNEGNQMYGALKPILEGFENVHKYAIHLNEHFADYLAARP